MADSKEPTELDMLKIAAAFDAGLDEVPEDNVEATKEVKQEVESSDNSEKPTTPENAEPKSTSNDAVVDEVPKTETTSTSSLTTQSDEPKSESASEKKQSKYQKAQSRLAKEWDDVKAERARLQAERESIEAAKTAKSSQEAAPTEAKASSSKFSADDYREAAKSYRDEGRDDLAKLAESKANEIETAGKRENEQKAQAEWKNSWDQNLLREVEANPELKDSSTNLYKAVSTLLQQHAILRNYPNGINDAVGLAKMRLKADAASDLEKKIAKYESELTQLRKATTPASGQPSGPARVKAFHELSSEEQGRELLKMAAEADRS
jgi:outer membrane biosynthesis protein TonB